MHLKHPDDAAVLQASLKFEQHLCDGDFRRMEDVYAVLKNIQKLDDEAEERHQAALALKQKAVEAEAERQAKRREAEAAQNVIASLCTEIESLGRRLGDNYSAAMLGLMLSDVFASQRRYEASQRRCEKPRDIFRLYDPTGNSAKREKCLRSVDNCVTKAIQHAASEKERTVLHSVRNVIRRLIWGDGNV